MPRSLATAGLDRPRTRWRSTSCSRAVSPTEGFSARREVRGGVAILSTAPRLCRCGGEPANAPTDLQAEPYLSGQEASRSQEDPQWPNRAIRSGERGVAFPDRALLIGQSRP